MTDADANQVATPLVVRAGKWLHSRFLLLLLGVYAVSGLLPGPGSAIREFEISLPMIGIERGSMLLLAVLLFCAAAVIDWSQIGEIAARPSTIVLGLLGAWVGPTMLVLTLGWWVGHFPPGEWAAGVMLGTALVAAMPVANSSAAWTQNSGGNVAVSLALIVASIVLSPLVTPTLLSLTGWLLTESDTDRIERIVRDFSGWRFILWVIVPSLCGALAALLAGRERIVRAKPWFRLITLVTILVLNYANASLAVKNLWRVDELPAIAAAAVLAAAICLVGIVLAVACSHALELQRGVRAALTFGMSMKHTGLALVLAGEFLKDEPRAILVVLLSTLAQHVAAAIVDQRLQWRQA